MLKTPDLPSVLPAKSSAKETPALRLAIIGLGKIGRVHLENLKHLPEAEILAIAEPHEGNRYDIPEDIALHDDWSSILTDPDIDAVVITLPHSLHAEYAMLALRHGKHVFLEKPLATKLEDARRLADYAEEVGKTLMVNMTHRFYPPMRRARQMIQEGVVGDVITIHDHYMEVIDRSEFPSWFFDPRMAGGGVTMTDSIHLLDRVSWLIDEPLFLKGQTSRTLDQDSLVEDCSELICQSSSGISATIGSFFCFDSAKTWADRLTIFGSKGTLTVHAWSHLEWTPHSEKAQRIDVYPPGLSVAERAAMGHRAAIEEFLNSVRDKRTPEASGHAVINAQEIVQHFYDNLDS